MLDDLGAAAWALPEVALDQLGLVGVHRVQCVGREKLAELVVGEVGHDGVYPAAASPWRRRIIPDRIRVLIVPSGSSRKAATSR